MIIAKIKHGKPGTWCDNIIPRRIRKLIPSDIMIKLYKAFILPHFEYASPLFIGLSKGLSAKLESTNA